MKGADLERAAVRVASALGPQDCVLIGGLAAGAHGHVRPTDDVDFLVRHDLKDAARRLRAAGLRVRPRRATVPTLSGRAGAVPFDVLAAVVPVRWSRAIEIVLAGNRRLRVIDVEGLVRLKLRAGRAGDIEDVAALVRTHPALRDRAFELALAYGIRGDLAAALRGASPARG